LNLALVIANQEVDDPHSRNVLFQVSYRMLAGDDTLGCVGWSTLNEICDRKVLVLGSGNDDESYCTSSGWTLASIDEANLILARGTFTICDGETTVHKDDDEDAYFRRLHEVLEIAGRRKVPMLVSNPDKVRPDEGFPPMPGAIADQYAQIIGSPTEVDSLIRRIGKPFPEVYELALQGRDLSKACMVGDALETDVTGGTMAGINTVWVVNDGIHGPEVSGKADFFDVGASLVLKEFNERGGTYAKGKKLKPSVVLRHFRW
jgi:ribonucleotide monophosphatase NagD (HAD superfamily)